MLTLIGRLVVRSGRVSGNPGLSTRIEKASSEPAVVEIKEIEMPFTLNEI